MENDQPLTSLSAQSTPVGELGTGQRLERIITLLEEQNGMCREQMKAHAEMCAYVIARDAGSGNIEAMEAALEAMEAALKKLQRDLAVVLRGIAAVQSPENQQASREDA